MTSRLIVLASFLFLLRADAQQDNRIKPGYKIGDTLSSDPGVPLLDEPALRTKIATFHDDELTRALPARFSDLKWQRPIALRDADYILCLFDSSVHCMPGDNPRVLILLTPDYQLKTWGRFTCEPAFAYGCIVNRPVQPNTYFVTINPQSRFGGTLLFEKYLISPTGIRKLGESGEIARIPNSL